MPKTTRLFIKSGLVYFVLGMSLAFVAELPSVNTGTLLLPVYWHMIVIGWITQLIMGVSIWMFPRRKKDRKKIDSLPSVLAFGTLNTGLFLRFTAEPFIPVFRDQPAITWVIIISSLLQISAVVFYLIEIWPRVKGRKNPARRSA
jgi:hypothetical protein